MAFNLARRGCFCPGSMRFVSGKLAVVAGLILGLVIYSLHHVIVDNVMAYDSIRRRHDLPTDSYSLNTNLPDRPSGQDTAWPLRLVYNRVPKCGSTSVGLLTRAMKYTNRFHYKYSTTYDERHVGLAQQRALVDVVVNTPPPMVYDRHVHYVNFTRFGHEQPGYINVVRRPLERHMSRYYFAMTQARGRIKHKTPGTSKDARIELALRNWTFDECVAHDHPLCTSKNSYFVLIPFFCGQDDFCLEPSTASLSAAKYNVLQNYILVGLTEEMAGFVEGLEKLLPRFFKGASQWFSEKNPHMMVSRGEKTYNQSTVDTMSSKLQEEYELYHFVQQLFHNKMASWRKTG